MEPRRGARTLIDPKVRHVGFTPQPPDPAASAAASSPPVTSLSPVMIPFPRRPLDAVHVGSYDPSDSSSTQIGDVELAEEWLRSSSGKYSLGFDMSGDNSPVTAAEEAVEKKTMSGELGVDEKSRVTGEEAQKEIGSTSKSSKQKTTKAERRALQEAQRAAKVAAKAEAAGGLPHGNGKTGKVLKQPLQRKDAPPTSSVNVSDNKGIDRPLDKDKRKDMPPPRMQYDDKSRVDKAKKRSVVKQTEVRNRVELFQHLPQYEYANQLVDLESKFFELSTVHPAVYMVGLQYLAGDVTGSNARCIAMLHAFKEAISDYHTPPEKSPTRDLTTRINSYVSFLIECRPLSISMGNAIRFLKSNIAKLPLGLAESEVKDALCSDIDRYIHEKIVIADKVIVGHAVTKVRDGDVLLTYSCSGVIEMTLLHAFELGKQFRVVIVDSRPKFEGQALLRRLVTKGLSCTYTHINAVSYIMHEVTRVLLGAASILSNGTVYSRIGTACVAMVAHEFRVPVLVCCEAYKFHERVQLDSICANELGDPDAILKVPGRKDVNYLDNLTGKENLQQLNLLYDATPSDYISMIVTDYGMVPPTSVPVIVREYQKEHLFI